jgi:hypothetical protein
MGFADLRISFPGKINCFRFNIESTAEAVIALQRDGLTCRYCRIMQYQGTSTQLHTYYDLILTENGKGNSQSG